MFVYRILVGMYLDLYYILVLVNICFLKRVIIYKIIFIVFFGIIDCFFWFEIGCLGICEMYIVNVLFLVDG